MNLRCLFRRLTRPAPEPNCELIELTAMNRYVPFDYDDLLRERGPLDLSNIKRAERVVYTRPQRLKLLRGMKP